MQMTKKMEKKVIAIIMMFMIIFNNCFSLFSGLVSFAADNSDDRITYSAEFVVLNGENEQQESEEEQAETETTIFGEDIENDEESSSMLTQENNINEMNNQENESNSEQEVEMEISVSDEEETEINEEQIEKAESLPNGLALEIVLGVKTNGYLKNAKIDIKDLANQIFKIRDNTSFGDYVQSIDEGKIKLKQISGGTEVKIYVPIELKDEDLIDVRKLQSGTQLSLIGTYVSEEGDEEIITKTLNTVLPVSNDIDLALESNIEKFIPYIKDERNEAIVQLKITLGTTTTNQLPIKDTTIEVQIPQVEGANIKDVNVSAISTGFTNGLMNGDVIFTPENWFYQDGKITISMDNTEINGKYQKNIGKDEYVISYTYENINQDEIFELTSSINAIVKAYTSSGENELQISKEDKYDLSRSRYKYCYIYSY